MYDLIGRVRSRGKCQRKCLKIRARAGSVSNDGEHRLTTVLVQLIFASLSNDKPTGSPPGAMMISGGERASDDQTIIGRYLIRPALARSLGSLLLASEWEQERVPS